MPPREPDFSSRAFNTAVEAKIDEVVRRYALMLLKWLISAMIGSTLSVLGAAIWATKVYIKIDGMNQRVMDNEIASKIRLEEWNRWRASIDEHFRQVDGRTGDRWTRSFMREYSAQVGYLNPAIKVPDPDHIANRGTPP